MVHHIRPLLCARIQRLKDCIFSGGMVPLALNSTVAQGGYACDHRIGCVGRASDVLQGEDAKAILKTNVMNHTVQRHDALRAFKGQHLHLIFHGGGHMYMIWTHLRFYNRHLANTMWYLQFHLGQFTRNYTQTEKRAADNKLRLNTKHRKSARCSACFVVWGFQRGFLFGTRLCSQSVVCYTLCRRCCENVIANREGKHILSSRKTGL